MTGRVLRIVCSPARPHPWVPQQSISMHNIQPKFILRVQVERTFAWEDKFKRLLLRFERIQQRHYGMKLMAYTLINLRAFCGA
jgi:transposase